MNTKNSKKQQAQLKQEKKVMKALAKIAGVVLIFLLVWGYLTPESPSTRFRILSDNQVKIIKGSDLPKYSKHDTVMIATKSVMDEGSGREWYIANGMGFGNDTTVAVKQRNGILRYHTTYRRAVVE